MAEANLTVITRAQVTSIVTPATKRFALVMDGQTVELGSTGSRDVSGLLAKVESVAAGMLVTIRDGMSVSIKMKVTPSSSGNVTVAQLPTSFAPDTTVYAASRQGRQIAIDTNGKVYASAAVSGQQEDGILTFVSSRGWPGALPGVPLGDPVVI